MIEDVDAFSKARLFVQMFYKELRVTQQIDESQTLDIPQLIEQLKAINNTYAAGGEEANPIVRFYDDMCKSFNKYVIGRVDDVHEGAGFLIRTEEESHEVFKHVVEILEEQNSV